MFEGSECNLDESCAVQPDGSRGLGAGEKADGGRFGGVLCESGRSCAGEEIAERISSPEI